MDFLLLAVTRMENGFCFAGMTKTGQWVRPVLPNKGQWKYLVYSNGENISIGDIINISGSPKSDPPHTEDIEVDGFRKISKLKHSALIDFLNKHSESETDLQHTLDRNNRSL